MDVDMLPRFHPFGLFGALGVTIFVPSLPCTPCTLYHVTIVTIFVPSPTRILHALLLSYHTSPSFTIPLYGYPFTISLWVLTRFHPHGIMGCGVLGCENLARFSKSSLHYNILDFICLYLFMGIDKCLEVCYTGRGSATL